MARVAAAIFIAIIQLAAAKKVNFIHWNQASPMFRIDNTDHIVDVEEYDQVNLICPVSKPGTRHPETHVIYSVSREEYDSCRITNPKPKIVAICNRPHRLMYFTITFRSFTPTPGGLEFRPGQDYFFISTSSRDDLHRRVGGGCSTHNMKMIFKVHSSDSSDEQQSEDEVELQEAAAVMSDLASPLAAVNPRFRRPRPVPTTTTTTERPKQGPRRRSGGYNYYYHPRDVVALENAFYRAANPDDSDIAQRDATSLRHSSSSSFSSSSTNSSPSVTPSWPLSLTLTAAITLLLQML